MRSAKESLCMVAVGVVFVGVGVGTWQGIAAMDRADRADTRRQDALFDHANVVCGAPPLKIIPHGSSWNYGPWVEVICQDGTTRAVR